MKRKMEFMAIAMKHYPEVKERLKSSGIEVDRSHLQPFFELFTEIMNEAYEMGYRDGKQLK